MLNEEHTSRQKGAEPILNRVFNKIAVKEKVSEEGVAVRRNVTVVEKIAAEEEEKQQRYPSDGRGLFLLIRQWKDHLPLLRIGFQGLIQWRELLQLFSEPWPWQQYNALSGPQGVLQNL